MADETAPNEGLNEEINEELLEKGKIVLEKGLGYTLTINREDLIKAAFGLKEAGFDLFLFAAGVDYPDSIKLVYRIYSSKRKNTVAITIKTEVPKSEPVIDSLVPVWSAAGWHERETYDLFGVIFNGHPDLRRIFMPEDWVGHPLRKDYSDNHMIVMEEPKKEKPAVAAKEKPAVKEDKPAPVNDKAETPKEEKTEIPEPAKAEVTEQEAEKQEGTGATETPVAEPPVDKIDSPEPAEAEAGSTEPAGPDAAESEKADS